MGFYEKQARGPAIRGPAARGQRPADYGSRPAVPGPRSATALWPGSPKAQQPATACNPEAQS